MVDIRQELNEAWGPQVIESMERAMFRATDQIRRRLIFFINSGFVPIDTGALKQSGVNLALQMINGLNFEIPYGFGTDEAHPALPASSFNVFYAPFVDERTNFFINSYPFVKHIVESEIEFALQSEGFSTARVML